MGDVPSWWKCQLRMTPWGLSFVTSLDRKQIAHQKSTESSCDLAFIINSNHLNTLCTCSTIGHIEEGTILIPVWSQFTTSSAGSSMLTVATTCFRNVFVSWETFTLLALLLSVVAYLCTNLNSEWAHCLLSSTWPPNMQDHTSAKCPGQLPLQFGPTLLLHCLWPSLGTAEPWCPTLGQEVLVFHIFSREEQQCPLRLRTSAFEIPRHRSSWLIWLAYLPISAWTLVLYRL